LAQATNRRVVITGLGLICGVGNTAPEIWRQLLAGASGVSQIKGFDPTGFPVTIAAEVKNFDPLEFLHRLGNRRIRSN
jgi:3-oxoacyl-[acyl-carrier-protein] synthase II